MPLFLEDFSPGDELDCGSVTVTAGEIKSFARSFDPQPFHLDEDEAARSPFGGLVASGWHTASLCHRLLVERFAGPGSGSMGSPGADEIRWLAPVRPGDTVHLRVRVLEVIPSRTKPDRGMVRVGYEVTNHRGERVMTMIGLGRFARRT